MRFGVGVGIPKDTALKRIPLSRPEPKVEDIFLPIFLLAQFRDAANERTKERTGNIEGQVRTDAPPSSGLASLALREAPGQAKRKGICPFNKQNYFEQKVEGM